MMGVIWSPVAPREVPPLPPGGFVADAVDLLADPRRGGLLP